MSKNKLEKFAENEIFKNVFQPPAKGIITEDFEMKGKWNVIHFKNNNPLVLELGCGKGEYSIALALENPNINIIGIDIKGARIWRGAKTATEQNINNVAFLRTKIEHITRFFAEDEISEIWIPFPDPQPKRQKKRLTSNLFLSFYQKILKNEGIIHLKTDSLELHQFTNALLDKNQIEPIEAYTDIYSENIDSILTKIQTFYEKIFLNEGKKITYVSFRLNKNKVIIAPDKTDNPGYKY
ncbi:MAG: tRNA (guanosine(46)-N7)-methyltransferase TrmB [Bacteroidales bacterium]|nr:tRNA (guanosine(46)-N7)-methyltransferase TrmB [Bacteroidales bacterium]